MIQMINIAICDDDIAMTTVMEEKLYAIANEQSVKINCDIFFDGSTLVKNIEERTYYDLIYLDIEMPKVNGINAAELIRDMEIPALIVYVSSYEKYLKELFNTEPFRFLSKPIDMEAFYNVFMDAYKRIRRKSEYFSFMYNKSFLKIPLDDIYYFESQNRVIHIHVGNGKNEKLDADEVETPDSNIIQHKFYGKMNDVEKQLSHGNGRFIRIHQSYLVNFDYIRKMTFSRITMTDGTVLQISEDRQKTVRTQFCTMAGMEVLNDG